jgi:GT2 family glycosyltransferase
VSDRGLPFVSVVFLAYNQRARLLESLQRMLAHSGYPRALVEVIVVDNASADGTAEAVARAYPDVRLLRNPANVGAPGWNEGFAVASGDYVLILDDDAYLPEGGLEAAVRAAIAADADLVSFSVVSSFDPAHPLGDDWRTGLFSYWGCAALVTRRALEALGGYDADIFIWANEVELTMRLLDLGLRHLYLPDVRAVHMKERIVAFNLRRYLANAHHHAYIAAKLMTPEDATATIGSIAIRAVVDAAREDRRAVWAVKEVATGAAAGVRHRRPVRRVVSRAYRKNFAPFVPPWRFMRTPSERVRARLRGGDAAGGQRERRRERFFAERARYYPRSQGSLRL